MRAAGLEVVSDILDTQCYLISTVAKEKNNQILQLIVQRITGYMTATSYKMISYNVSKAKLAAVLDITPGKKAPTVTPLADEKFVAIQALIQTKNSSEVMDRLEAAGATDILLFDLCNSRM